MTTKDTATELLWGEHEIPIGNPLYRTLGNLHFWCQRDEMEIRIGYVYSNETASTEYSATNFPEDTLWQRWAFRQKTPRIFLRPVFPDIPVMVKPEAMFRIAEDARVRIYIRVPIWIRMILSGAEPTTLLDLPAVKLSRAWFGSFLEGEMCYWISSGTRRNISADLTRPYMAICPLELIDNSPEDLNVEKIVLRVANLSLFVDDNQLWSDETRVYYKGKTEVNEIKFGGKAPAEAKAARLLSEPREKIKKALYARTFATFRDLPGLGFLSR